MIPIKTTYWASGKIRTSVEQCPHNTFNLSTQYSASGEKVKQTKTWINQDKCEVITFRFGKRRHIDRFKIGDSQRLVYDIEGRLIRESRKVRIDCGVKDVLRVYNYLPDGSVAMEEKITLSTNKVLSEPPKTK